MTDGIYVKVSFSTGAFATPSWTDISSDVMSISTNRGRQDEMNRIETGTLTVVLKNTSGNYWPDLTTGDYYPNIIPLKQIQVTRVYNDVTYGVFRGLIEGWTPGFLISQGMKVPIVRLTCVDPMKSLARYLCNSESAYAQEKSGARIGRVLTAMGFSGDDRAIDTGDCDIQALDPVTNINALEHIQMVAEAEYGQFFFDGDGKAVFHDRSHRNATAVEATFGNPPVDEDVEFNNIDYAMDDQYIYNDIHCTIEGGAEQISQDATSITAYGQRSLELTGLLLISDAEAESYADYLLALYKDPKSRVRSLEIRPAADPANLYPLALGLDISDRIGIRLTEAGLLREFFIEGVGHSWDAKAPELWTTIWQLSNAGDQDYWILGDETYGIYGDTARMGF